MTPNKTMKKLILACALACFAGTAFAGIAEIARDAKAGKKSAQKQLSARYANGNEVVKDDLLSEQWLLRADKNLNAKSGGNALELLQKKRAEEAGEKSPESKKSTGAKSEAAKPQKPPRAVRTEDVDESAPEEDVIEETEEVAEAPNVSVDDFHRLLRAASQGNRLALQRFQTDATMRNRLVAYARTPEGRRNPFVQETIRRLKK